ncbi:MAG: fluoride efflux transporter CrcB [Longimicrobiales bacterium]
MTVLYIALGGAAGAVARYGLGGWIQARAGSSFPLGTLVVNVVGSLLLGFVLHYLEAVRLAPELRASITIGLLGAFTTFSTFSYETVEMLGVGAWGKAGAYALGSLLLGLGAVIAGSAASAWLLAGRS